MITCAVGSSSPPKLKAVEEVFKKLVPKIQVVISALPMESHVSSQPMGEKETEEGCLNRLNGLKKSDKKDADFLISFEGGIINKKETMAVIAVSLGSKYNESFVSISRTGTFLLPPGILERIEQGMELGLAANEEFGSSEGKNLQGSIGLLTDGLLTRVDYYSHALHLALVPFVNASRYRLVSNPLVKNGDKKVNGCRGKETAASVDDNYSSFEELKKSGNDCYLKAEFVEAVNYYSRAIKSIESVHTDEPEDEGIRKSLSILYTNRAMANLSRCKESLNGKPFNPKEIPKEARAMVMKANADSSTACDLDKTNAKAFFRKGQALLWLSGLPQRAKEAIEVLETALSLPLTPSVKTDVENWLEYAKNRLDETTNMPENCKQQ